MRITFITTVLNEEKTIAKLLSSLLKQTLFPHEVVIVDGGSSDETIGKINQYIKRLEAKKIKVKVLVRHGNRSVGRNEAIRAARGDIIACSDAGCILDEQWIEKVTSPFIDETVDVVAGYYQGKPENMFQTCLVPYVLVMEDRLDADNFLPASRSMAFRKRVWEQVGGFPVEYSHNEDYVYSRKLYKLDVKMHFAKEAIVYWIPRKTLREAYVMFFRFAFGDIEAGILRPKVLLIFLRYLVGLALVGYFIYSGKLWTLIVSLMLFGFYVIWSIRKNYEYVKNIRAVQFLPLIQITSDVAVMAGSSLGLGKKLWSTLELQ